MSAMSDYIPEQTDTADYLRQQEDNLEFEQARRDERVDEYTPAERQAELEDAQRNIAEVDAVLLDLWPDRDDPETLSQVTSLLNSRRHSEEVLKAHGIDPTTRRRLTPGGWVELWSRPR